MMIEQSRKDHCKLLFLFVLLAALTAIAVPGSAQESSLKGASSTMLPGGGVLVAGGFAASSAVSADAFIAASDGSRTKLSQGLIVARAGHTATVLPDGTIFIFGGVDSSGHVVRTAELFDPATKQFSVLPDVLAVPRAFHTATLITDGTLLLTGGVLPGGEFPDDVQFWDYRSKKALSFHALLSFPREGHTAALLSDGTVSISGGTDHFGKPVKVDEIFDPVTKRFRFASGNTGQADPDSMAPLRIAESIPQDGAVAVPIQAQISFRFSKLLNVATIQQTTFILVGPDGTPIQAQVTPAEQGRLVFLVPAAPLQPGTEYSLRVAKATAVSGESIADVSMRFTTEGVPPDNSGPDFVPGPGWTSGTGNSKWEQLPALRAPAGETAVSGQVLKLNGWPLQHVTLEMDGKRAHTDDTGRFLLRQLSPGHHVLWIDGTTANHANASYGIYEVGVTVLPNKTNVLNYTIWMTRLDTVHAVNIPSPTTQETVLTNPSIPGLELHLPAHTTITDLNGKTVRQVTITPVPLDKPPFPLPAGVNVPLYFTVQPGGAYISVASPANGPKVSEPRGATLIYPNAFHYQPGTPFAFWNYDADAKGWYVYGAGKVTADDRSIIPDPGAEIYEFTGAMVGSGGGPGKGAVVGNPAKAGDPVDLSTGQFIYSKTDLALPDTLPINFTRTYITNDSWSRGFGIGATDSYDIFLQGDTSPWTFQELILPDGGRVRFDRISPGTGSGDAVYIAATATGPFYGAVLSWNSDHTLPGDWKIVLKNGTIYSFPTSIGSVIPACQAVLQIKDRYGNTIKLDRAPSTCVLTRITSTNGRYITVTSDANSRITQISDNIGRNVGYTYDAAGRLSTVTDANGGVTTYTYDDQNRMLTIRDARNIVYLTNQYDGAGRVLQQTEADNGTYLFNWTPAQASQIHFSATYGQTEGGAGGALTVVRDNCWGSGGYKRYDSTCAGGYMALVAQVDVTDPRGYVRRVKFNNMGYTTSDTRALGQPEEQTATYAYYSDNLLQSVTDALGRVTSFDYDGLGNVTRITRLDGTQNAVTSTFAYGGAFGQLSSATDPLNHTSTFAYDGNGNLITATDALNHSTSFAYNSAGQVSSVTDALNNTVQFGYSGGDLASVIDPLGNMSSQFTDGAGRTILAMDPAGNTSLYQYSPLNLVTQVTDPKGNNTTFSYDPNGNLLSLTDAANHTTSYTYDNMDRVQTRTDALQRQSSYTYNLNGNIANTTDRKGLVTSFAYDALNRPKMTGYNTVVNGGNTTYESTTAYTYDAASRMTQVADSAGGTITDAYDNLDRLTSEATTQGVVSYGYDTADRRTTMTVAGQPQLTYSYDNANRLTGITQGTSSVGFSYDNGNRRSSMTLPNGITVSYSLDNDSRIAGITYNFGGNTLGNLTYAYDQLGRRTQVGGSFARTNLPGAVTSAVYDDANQLTQWNGITISYDANGNMLSDGSNVFTWNARNQVATLNGVALQYDALGRRTKNAYGKSFLFDGPNATQEISGSTVTANLWTGGLDELFQRSDSNGTVVPLTDALGSTVALVDSSGNIQTTYSYDPFGNTTASGTSSANPSQYTGRENEGNGLYFYRSRYYSPLLGRFISQDPLGFVGSGPNLYAYVFNSPTNLSDPNGLNPALAPGVVHEIVVVLEGMGYTQAEIDAAIAYLAGGGGEGVAICASTVVCGLIVLDTALLVNDSWQFYRLGQAYGWWGQPKRSPTPTPAPNPAPALSGRKDKNNDNDDCDSQFTACLHSGLADFDGHVHGSSRCEECRQACVRGGGWPSSAPRTRGSVRCDYWNFPSTLE